MHYKTIWLLLFGFVTELTEDMLLLLSFKNSWNLGVIKAQERFSAIHGRSSFSIAQQLLLCLIKYCSAD